MPANPGIQPWLLRRAAHVVRMGGIIAYPTESVFGLGCDPLNASAVHRLLALKQREESKGLILISDNFERLEPFLAHAPEIFDPLRKSWPGPVTLLLPASEKTPKWLRGEHTTLAVRVTQHPIAVALCRVAETPLVSTSANLTQHPPALNPLQVRLRCGDQIDFIVHGKTGGLVRPTEIRDAITGTMVRKG